MTPWLDVADLKGLLHYDSETGRLYWRKRECAATERALKSWNTKFAGKEYGGLVYGYRVGSIMGRPCPAHIIVFAMEHGRWPQQEIDHIDGDRSNNRISNLRDVSTTENRRNSRMRHSNKSGTTGVCWITKTKKWRADISCDKGRLYLGEFANKADAIIARKAAERRHGYHPNHGSKPVPEMAGARRVRLADKGATITIKQA